ncbi:MAG: patatin-like phospholipase family protein [Actinomycetota bacterium]
MTAPVFTNLVFEGGGVKGVAYVGALQALDERGILPDVRGVAGTSAGAITAALVAVGTTWEQLQQTLLQLDFTVFDDGGWDGPLRVVEKYGWYAGDAFHHWMQEQMKLHTGSADATFADVQTRKGIDLRVVTTDLSVRGPKVLSASTTPDLPVALGVRMSMSIPFYFAAVDLHDVVYVDGGAVWNYPIEIFDQGRGPGHRRVGPGTDVHPASLGFHLGLTTTPTPRSVHNLVGFTKCLYEAVMNVQADFFRMVDEDIRRTVFIDDLGLSATDFAITPAQKKQLIENGYQATAKYLVG